MVSLMKKIFNKYEQKNELANVSVLVNRMQMIKRNILEMTYIFTNVFIPRFCVILIACYSIFMLNKKIGLILIGCLIVQFTTMTMSLNKCVSKSYSQNENKDIKPNVILHLKCSMKDLQNHESTTNSSIHKRTY